MTEKPNTEKISTEKFAEMYRAFQNGELFETEWKDICKIRLHQILEEHKDVLIRLANR